MKRVVSVSLGSARRDHRVQVELLGEPFEIARRGTDGDFDRAVGLFKELDGKEYLFYPTWPLDVAFIRATSADEHGNLSFEDEPSVSCALAMALGTIYGGLRIIRTRRYKVFELQSLHGFVSGLSSAIVILSFSLAGAPISTTHVFASTIVGAGSSKRLSGVRWGIARSIIVVWILTIPAAALMGAMVFHLLKMI